MIRRPPRSTLFPYTSSSDLTVIERALDRAGRGERGAVLSDEAREVLVQYAQGDARRALNALDRKSTRLNSSHGYISYAVFCLKKKKVGTVERTAGTQCCEDQ